MTAKEFFNEEYNGVGKLGVHCEELMQNYAKLKCQELLEIVVEKADARMSYVAGGVNRAIVNKDSILNAVNLDEFIK